MTKPRIPASATRAPVSPRLQTLKPELATLTTRLVRVLDTKAGATAWVSGGGWMTTRSRIQKRDLYTCAACGRVRSDHEVDHRVPLEQRGSNDDGKLQLLCRGPGGCHAKKTAAAARRRCRWARTGARRSTYC